MYVFHCTLRLIVTIGFVGLLSSKFKSNTTADSVKMKTVLSVRQAHRI